MSLRTRLARMKGVPQKANDRRQKDWQPPPPDSVGGAPGEEYRINFGMYSGGKGKTIREILAVNPNYFKNMMGWKNNILDIRPV